MHTPATDPKLCNLGDSTYILIVIVCAITSRIVQYKSKWEIHIQQVKL